VEPQHTQRKLTTILAADVEGYARLMRADEEATLETLGEYREIIDVLIARHDGRVFSTGGDSVLAEFGSAVEAVRCAISCQEEIASRNAELADDRKLLFRIGINVGDVMVRDDDLFGDGVNVAARLEGLAQAGGVCVASSVFEQVKHKLSLGFEDLGPQEVKNITEPVSAYRLVPGSVSVSAGAAADREPAFELPDKPSIAVLPFENISGDPEQGYFADGMAEDIITALSHFRWFFVIARNSSFTYKGRAVDVRTVGRELGARYVLEGSVRKGGNRLRINAQLIETETGNHLWAEKFDGALEDVFDLQDRITEGVAGAIEPSLRQAEVERARRKRPENLDAYDLYLRALPHAWAWAPEEQEKSVELLEAALEIDPHYVAAHGLLAWSYSAFVVLDPSDSRRDKSVQHARAVLGPNTDDSLALAFASFALALFERDYDAALSAVDRALSLTPNSPTVLAYSAASNAFAGHFDTAIEQAQASLRLSPFDPLRFTAEVSAGYGYFFSGRYHDAAEAALRCIHINPQFLPGYPLVVASRIREDRAQDARQAVERLLGFKPDFRVSEFIRVGRFSPDLNEAYAAALREAGLPE
jgi:TolB-like protein